MISPARSSASTPLAAIEQVVDAAPSGAGPYAMPVDATLGDQLDASRRDPIRASVGPFVPAPWRQESEPLPAEGSRPPAVAAELTMAEEPAFAEPLEQHQPKSVEADLPWIDAFADVPEMGTVSQITRVEQGFQKSSFIDETLYPLHDEDAATFDLSAERAGEQADDVAALFVAPLHEADPPIGDDGKHQDLLPTFESAWEDAEPIDPQEPIEYEVRSESSAASVSEVPLHPAAEPDASSLMESPVPEVDPAPEDWPLVQAANEVEQLANQLPLAPPNSADVRHEAGPPYSTPLGVPPVAVTPPMSMWADDDLMDLMPVRLDAAEAGAADHWSKRNSASLNRRSEQIAAADAIDSIARRVRQGELTVPGYAEGMSEAAALAAALTALLSATP